MALRNSTFSSRKPFENDDALSQAPSRVSGPFPWLNPTRARFHYHDASGDNDHASGPGRHFAFKWSSRDNRKGRHQLVLTPSTAANESISTPPTTSNARAIANGIWRMFTVYPIYDVSYLVATLFTLGSVVWVFNAFFVFLPLLKPSTTFDGEILYGGGITAFIGATIFEIGSVLLMLEAVNENREGCFGWALEEALEGWTSHDAAGGVDGGRKGGRLRIARASCSHHHPNKKNLVGKGSIAPSTSDHKPTDGDAAPERSWTWFPSYQSLRTHYIHELGFLACASQLFGATIFWIAGFTALPGIFNHMSPGLIDGVYWTPQVVGGSGFIVSGTLFMLETQRKWYLPAFKVLGWHIGLFNLIGGVGFTLSPAFGYDTSSWAQYQAACSTFWGSWAFLIGSAVQWYESLDKYPVTIKKD